MVLENTFIAVEHWLRLFRKLSAFFQFFENALESHRYFIPPLFLVLFICCLAASKLFLHSSYFLFKLIISNKYLFIQSSEICIILFSTYSFFCFLCFPTYSFVPFL